MKNARFFKKAAALGTACVLSASLLAGCGGAASSEATVPADTASTTTETANNSTDSGEKTEIVFWTTQRHDLDFMEQKIQEFNETNDKNIVVKYEAMTDNYDNNLELAFQSNQAPDIFRPKSEIVPYVKKGMAIPIDEYLTDEDRERYGDTLGVQNINTYEGKTYSLPAYGNNYRLSYNRDIFRKAGLDPDTPPTTMEELREDARIITEKLKSEGIYGFAMNLKNAYSAMYRSVDEVARLSDMFYYDFSEGKYDFTDYAKVVQSFADIYADGSFFPGAESLDMDPLRTQFALGKIGMYISGYWEVSVYDSQFPTDQDWAACVMPTYDGTVDGVNTMNSAGRSFCISSQCKNPEAAWEVLKYISTDEFMAEYQEGGYGNIIVPSIAAKAKTSTIYGSDFFKLADTDTIQPLAPEMAGLEIEGRTFYDEFGAVILGEESIDGVADAMTEKYNAALNEAVSSGSMQPIVKE